MFFLSCKTGGFFYSKTTVANNHDEIPYQPVLWRVFTSILDKKNRKLGLKQESQYKKLKKELNNKMLKAKFLITFTKKV